MYALEMENDWIGLHCGSINICLVKPEFSDWQRIVFSGGRRVSHSCSYRLLDIPIFIRTSENCMQHSILTMVTHRQRLTATCIGGSKRGATDAPCRVQFLSFSCSFQEKISQIIVWRPHLGIGVIVWEILDQPLTCVVFIWQYTVTVQFSGKN